MTNSPCPVCGHLTPTDATDCPSCGHVLANGTVPGTKGPYQPPPPPSEVASWVIHKTPPEILEEMRQTFDEAAFLAELREAERNGGCELKDFIHGLEQEEAPRD